MSAERAIVLGGSFDPIHMGHLEIAEAVGTRLGIERVLLLLSPRPPHKAADDLSAPAHRERMVEAAIAGRSGWRLCRLELEREGVGYTIDTLRELREGGIEPIFVVGGDSLVELPTWKDWQAMIAEFDLAVVDRRDKPAIGLAPQVQARLIEPEAFDAAGRGGRIVRVATDPIPISSSEIRRRAARGEPIDALVPPGVARYIRDEGLFRAREEGDDLPSQLPPAVQHAVDAAVDKKALETVVLDLRGLSDVTDHFVICHGTADRQVVAIADNIERTLREAGIKPISVEGRRSGDWVLMDFVDFVVHVFNEDKRDFYRLERLWGDAPTQRFGDDVAHAATPGG